MMTDLEQERFETEVVGHTLRLYYSDASQGRQILPDEPPTKSRDDAEAQNAADKHALETAEQVVRIPSVRERICKALGAVTDDVRDLAKTVTTALLPLAIAGKPVVPASSLVFAWIAIIILRAGVKSFCPGSAAKAEA